MAVDEVSASQLSAVVPVAPVEIPRESPAVVQSGGFACRSLIEQSFLRKEQPLGVGQQLRGTEETGGVLTGSNHSVTALATETHLP